MLRIIDVKVFFEMHRDEYEGETLSSSLRLWSLIVFISFMMLGSPFAREKPQALSTNGQVSASDKTVSFVATVGQEYAIGVAASEVYTLIERSGSPTITKIEVPLGDLDQGAQYAISFFTNGGFSAPVIRAPLETVTAPPGATGIKVTLLDESGAQISSPADFAFYLSFSADGNVKLDITGNEPPLQDTYIPTILPPGGNPPISGASKLVPEAARDGDDR